ncbi:Zinc finger, GRF-type [Sesbania bispinosa]|nr:Zinc finger, GRF-type [Sesbania bispinosa]
MQGKGKGIDNVREKRSASCRSSSSSSIARRMLFSCGEEVALLKSKSVNNPGRIFWICPNWNKQINCSFFRWADGEMADMQQPNIEDWQLYEEEIEELKRKV